MSKTNSELIFGIFRIFPFQKWYSFYLFGNSLIIYEPPDRYLWAPRPVQQGAAPTLWCLEPSTNPGSRLTFGWNGRAIPRAAVHYVAPFIGLEPPDRYLWAPRPVQQGAAPTLWCLEPSTNPGSRLTFGWNGRAIPRAAVHYVAPFIGLEPPDRYLWAPRPVQQGAAPTFFKWPLGDCRGKSWPLITKITVSHDSLTSKSSKNLYHLLFWIF